MYRCSLLWFYTIFFGGTFCEAWKCKLLEFHIRCRSAATVLWCDGPLLWRRMPQCSVVWCLTAKLCCLDDKLPMWMLPNFVLFCFCTKRKKKACFCIPTSNCGTAQTTKPNISDLPGIHLTARKPHHRSSRQLMMHSASPVNRHETAIHPTEIVPGDQLGVKTVLTVILTQSVCL